jgi:hypothetical protein
MDELLQKAIDRRAQLRVELEAIDRFIASYGSIVDRAEASSSGTLFDEVGDAPAKTRAERAVAVKAMIDQAVKEILGEGRPLTRSELMERLEAAGFELEGSDKSKVLGTTLWRSARFFNVKGHGYWPKGTPIPQRFASLERRKSMLG